MCFEYPRVIFHWKNGSKFSNLLTVKAEAADSLTVKYPFFWRHLFTEELKLISLKYNATWHYWELGCLLLLCFCISRLVLQKNYDISQLNVFTWKSSCTCCKISGLPQYGGSRCEILCCCRSLPSRRLCKCTLWSSDLFRCWSCFRFSPSLSSLLPPAARDPRKTSNLGRSSF